MVNLYFTYGRETRDGFDSKHPEQTAAIEADSVDEIQGENVLEKVPNLIKFMEECYRILKKGQKCKFSAPHYASSRAWVSPLTVRAISEYSLNFTKKAWREQNKYTEAEILCDFEVNGSAAIEENVMQRAEETRMFWLLRYNNVAQAVLFELTKL